MIAIQRLISGMIRRLCGKARQGKLAEYVCGDWGGRRVLMTGRPTTAFCHHNFNSTTVTMCTAHLILWEYFFVFKRVFLFLRSCTFVLSLDNVGFSAEDCVFDVLDVIAMILCTFPCRQVALLNRGLL